MKKRTGLTVALMLVVILTFVAMLTGVSGILPLVAAIIAGTLIVVGRRIIRKNEDKRAQIEIAGLSVFLLVISIMEPWYWILFIFIFVLSVNLYIWSNVGVKKEMFVVEVPPSNYFSIIVLRNVVQGMISGNKNTRWTGSGTGPNDDIWEVVPSLHHGWFNHIIKTMCGGVWVWFPPRQRAEVEFLFYELLQNGRDADGKVKEIGPEASVDEQTTYRIAVRNEKSRKFSMSFTSTAVYRHVEAGDDTPCFFIVQLSIAVTRPEKYMYYGSKIGAAGLKLAHDIIETAVKRYAKLWNIQEIILEDTTSDYEAVSEKSIKANISTKSKGFIKSMLDFYQQILDEVGLTVKARLIGFGTEDKSMAQALQALEKAKLLGEAEVLTAHYDALKKIKGLRADRAYVASVLLPLAQAGGQGAVQMMLMKDMKNITTLALGNSPFAVTAPVQQPTGTQRPTQNPQPNNPQGGGTTI